MARTIVITGGGAGLGRAVARRFAQEGDTVVLLGRTGAKVEAVAAELGGGAVGLVCDVASPASVRAAFAAIGARFGSIDVLVNNAAIFEPFEIADATDAQILGTIATNIGGPMLCVREAIPLLGRGSLIVNVSSESVTVPFAHLLVYQASKAALEKFSEGLAGELRERGIRVSVVRAGQMMGEDSAALAVAPEVAQKFARKCAENGVDIRGRGISHYTSVTESFVALVNMPPDLHIGLVALSARPREA